jgi:hypothetical protein
MVRHIQTALFVTEMMLKYKHQAYGVTNTLQILLVKM